MAPLAAAVGAERRQPRRLDAAALRRHHHHHVLLGQLAVVPGRHRAEEVGRLEEHLAEAQAPVEREARVHVGDAEGDVVDALGAWRSRQRLPEARPLDHLDLAAPRVVHVGDVERHVVGHHGARERRHQRPAARQGGEACVHRLEVADVQADLADAELAPGGSLRDRRGAVAVEHLHELDAARPDGRGRGVRDHRDARLTWLTARQGLAARHGAAVVEEHVREADASVEVERDVHVADPDADVVDAAEGHAAPAVSTRIDSSIRTARIAARLASSVTGRRGLRTSPPGWPSIFMIAFSWLW